MVASMDQVGIQASASQPGVDRAKLQRMLGTLEMSWLVDRIRARLERGERLDGTVTLVGATASQRRAVARLLGHNPGRASSLSVSLPAVAVELRRAGAAPSLQVAVEVLGGPVRNLAAERAEELQRWSDALGAVRASRLAGLPWFAEWQQAIRRDGTVTRLVRQGQGHLLGQAAAVLEHLPSSGDPTTAVLSTLSATVTGDPHALSGSALGALVLRALAVRESVEVPVSPDGRQALWATAGIVTDDLSSQVLVLNVRAGGELAGKWLTEAADAGQPFRLTLRQLTDNSVLPWALDIFVCAGSALVRAAADDMGAECPALVCTEGEPSVAALRLLQAAASSGSTVHWHADFSWPGLRSTAMAIRQLKARPWHMDADDYQAGLADGGGAPLRGRPEPCTWDPRLAELMQRAGRVISEDRVLDRLLPDLVAHQRHPAG
jgi:uncharacterized protein (TIGR02679 family)